MRKLYQRLVLLYLISALLFVLLFAVSLYLRGRKENGYYLYQLLGAVDSNLEEAAGEYEEEVRHLSGEYTTYAREVAYILAREERMAEAEGLETLRELMDVGAISLFDEKGEVVVTTEESLQGSRVDPECMDGEEKTCVQVDEPDFWDRPAYFYVVAPMENVEGGSFAGVRIDVDIESSRLTSGAERVRDTLKRATTEYDTSILAAGKARGLIIGITENNRQEIEFEQVQEGNEMVEFMDALPEGEPVVLKINGEWQSVVVRERHDMYLAAFTAMDQVAADMRTTLVAGLCAVAVISGLTIFMVRVFVRKYLFDHFRQIQTGIYDVLEGKRNLAEEDSEIPELKPLAEMIFRLEREYMEKAEGLTRMEGELSAAKNEADYDRLTGLYNRNGFEQRAENYLQSGRAEGALLLFDLDDFKKVNDREGHPAGDQVLITFARCLTDTFRKEDVIARLGGDEFVVLLPGRISKDILEEKFRALFDRVHETFGDREEARRVSVSAGAVLADDTVREYEDLYACADTALYIAKDLGKARYYINDKKIRCMRRECIGCREDCPRSRILKGERK